MYELKVDGMTCGGCAASVTRALQRLDSNARVDVDLPNKSVKVEMSTHLDAVKKAIEDAGYEVLGTT